MKITNGPEGWMVCASTCLGITDTEVIAALDALIEKDLPKKKEKLIDAPADKTADAGEPAAEGSSPIRKPKDSTTPEKEPANSTPKMVMPKDRKSTNNIRFVDDPSLGRLVNVGAERTPVPADAVAYMWGPDGKVKWLTAADFAAPEAATADSSGGGTHATGDSAEPSNNGNSGSRAVGNPPASNGPIPANTNAINTPTGRVTALTYNNKRISVPATATAYYFQGDEVKFVHGNERPTDSMGSVSKATRKTEPASMAGMVSTPPTQPTRSAAARSTASANLPTLNFGAFHCPPCEGVKASLRNRGINPDTGRDQNGQQLFYVTSVDWNTAVKKGGVPCAQGSTAGLGINVRSCNF